MSPRPCRTVWLTSVIPFFLRSPNNSKPWYSALNCGVKQAYGFDRIIRMFRRNFAVSCMFMTEETISSKMTAHSLHPTRRHIPDSRNLHGHRRENPLYHRLFFLSRKSHGTLHLNVSQTDMLWGRLCTYEATLRREHVTIVAVENNKHYIFWVCVCSLSYPACKAHMPCGLSGSTVFFHIIW